MKNIQLDLMIIVSPKGGADKILECIKSFTNMHSIFKGRGTAPNDILSALGIGEPEKDIMFCFIEQKNIKTVYSDLKELYPDPKKGIVAMTIPVSAVGGNLTLQILLGKTKDLI